MTRQKKIEKEIEIESFIYHFIRRAGSFDYWLDGYWLFPQVAYSCQCSPRLVKKIFFKKLYSDKKFREWINYFEY